MSSTSSEKGTAVAIGIALVVLGIVAAVAYYFISRNANTYLSPTAANSVRGFTPIVLLLCPPIIAIGIAQITTRRIFTLWHIGAAIVGLILFWGVFFIIVMTSFTGGD